MNQGNLQNLKNRGYFCRMKIHREGYRYILIASVTWALLGFVLVRTLLDWPIINIALNIIFFLLWFWIIWFFRLPNRTHIHGENKITAPADGKVVVIEETFE